ncbi:MAG: helix-turn-helix domain-containing protein [Candidatus Thiodiazotropha sp. (ex Ustalcina ferruginea)]|nr:helix-turn-helix domain-containing protein [Candidatus Thiodiazotropha sp. (ex Ustalcina ferruginea)]
MLYVLEYLAEALKTARQRKKLSQRGLSQAAGMPQAQISKIENAAVDMRVSTLIELARTLDLELMLVPRKHVFAVRSIVGADQGSLNRAKQQPVYALESEDDDA